MLSGPRDLPRDAPCPQLLLSKSGGYQRENSLGLEGDQTQSLIDLARQGFIISNTVPFSLFSGPLILRTDCSITSCPHLPRLPGPLAIPAYRRISGNAVAVDIRLSLIEKCRRRRRLAMFSRAEAKCHTVVSPALSNGSGSHFHPKSSTKKSEVYIM